MAKFNGRESGGEIGFWLRRVPRPEAPLFDNPRSPRPRPGDWRTQPIGPLPLWLGRESGPPALLAPAYAVTEGQSCPTVGKSRYKAPSTVAI